MKKLNEQKVRALAELLKKASAGLKIAAEISAALSFALDESCRIRAALNRARVPADYAELVDMLTKSDERLGEALRGAVVDKFELGKLWLTATDPHNWLQLHWGQKEISEILEQFYSVPFKVKVRQKNDG